MTSIRSLLFLVLCGLIVVPYCVVVSLSFFLPHRLVFKLGYSYATIMNWLMKVLCKIDVVVEGREHLPNVPSVVLIKHSSPWETLAEFLIFPPGVIVLKRELMWIPLFGWALASLKSIAINRRAGRSAIAQILEQGKARLAQGIWINIFPEGTRVANGRVGRFGIGGALLACESRVPLVPVAHNAGDHWPSGVLRKTPGTITLRIGAAISTADKSPEQVNSEAKAWMEAAMKDLSSAYR